jgi:predicted TIM-barrel fold metal-dependent hydrolase
MATPAREPNVRVEISGLGLPGRPWTVADNRWIVRETIPGFGAAREARRLDSAVPA